MLWGAISRAVRVPTRLERDIDLDVTDPTADPVLRLVGNKDFHSEELVAYEAGYRWQASSKLGMDFNVYHNVYRGLAAAERATPFIGADGHIIVPAIIRNLSDGEANGATACRCRCLPMHATAYRRGPQPWPLGAGARHRGGAEDESIGRPATGHWGARARFVTH